MQIVQTATDATQLVTNASFVSLTHIVVDQRDVWTKRFAYNASMTGIAELMEVIKSILIFVK